MRSPVFPAVERDGEDPVGTCPVLFPIEQRRPLGGWLGDEVCGGDCCDPRADRHHDGEDRVARCHRFLRCRRLTIRTRARCLRI